MTSEYPQQPEPAKPGCQALMRAGKPTPNIPAATCLMTHGTADFLGQTQESVQLPPPALSLS